MNFQNIFEELSKLYEEKSEEETVEAETSKDEEVDVEAPIDEQDTAEENPDQETANDAESDVRQLALECANCGAITIKDEADVKVDEETDLANMEDTCEFCEEAKGHKIVGVVTPYETSDEEIEIVDDEAEPAAEDEAPVEESLVEGISVKYGRGKPAVEFDSLEAAVKHINDGMKKKAEDSYILYNNGKEMIWLDWYQASRDGSNNGYTVSRQDDKKTIKFEPNAGLSIIGELDEDVKYYSTGKPVRFHLEGDALSVYNELMKHKPRDNNVYIQYTKNDTIALEALYETKDLIYSKVDIHSFDAACDNLEKSIKIPTGAKIMVFGKFGISLLTIAVRVENISFENKLDERYFDDEVGAGSDRNTPYDTQRGKGVWKNTTPDWYKKQGGSNSSWGAAKDWNRDTNKPYRP